jgi:hypothetical protein
VSESQLVGVPPEHIHIVWPLIENLVSTACRWTRGRFLPDDIKLFLLDGKCQLWLSWRDGKPEAFCVTEVVCYPRKKICRLFLGAGRDRNHWLGFEPLVTAWAKSNGCTGFELIGRPGWRRALRHWEMETIVLVRDFA